MSNQKPIEYIFHRAYACSIPKIEEKTTTNEQIDIRGNQILKLNILH